MSDELNKVLDIEKVHKIVVQLRDPKSGPRKFIRLASFGFGIFVGAAGSTLGAFVYDTFSSGFSYFPAAQLAIALLSAVGVILFLFWRAEEATNALRLHQVESGLNESRLRSEYREKILKMGSV